MERDPRLAVARFVFTRENLRMPLFIFLAAAGIFIDVWDLTALGIVLTPFRNYFDPGSAMLALAVSSANIGAVFGAIFGGLLTDRLGRRSMFIYSMIIFVVTAFLQALSTNIYEFTIFRTIMGFGLGSDVATGFSYIYEFISDSQRRKFYSLWAYAFSATAILAVLVSMIFYYATYSDNLIWRVPFILGGFFATVIIILRYRIPETPIWLAYSGRYRKAREVLQSVYGEIPEGIPLEDGKRGTLTMIRMLKDVFAIGKNRVLGFAMSLNVIVGVISWGFSFYVTYSLTSLGITSFAGALFFDLFIYGSAFAGSFLSPYFAVRAGTRYASVIPSFGIAVTLSLALLAALGFISIIYFVPLSAATLFLEYLGPMSYNAIVNHAFPSSVRGSVNGVNYMVNKIVEAITGYLGFLIIAALGNAREIAVLLFLTVLFSMIALVLGSNVFQMDPGKVESETVAGSYSS